METIDLLVENVHYRARTYRVGEWNGREYCYDNFSGEAQTLELVHPDVTEDAIAKLGDRLRNLRMLRNRREFDRRGRNSV